MTVKSTLCSKAGELCAKCLRELRQESSVTGLRRCQTAETHDWQPQRKTSGVSTRLPDACDSFQSRTRRFQSLYSCRQRNRASFNSLRSNNKRPLTSFQESVKRKKAGTSCFVPASPDSSGQSMTQLKIFSSVFSSVQTPRQQSPQCCRDVGATMAALSL